MRVLIVEDEKIIRDGLVKHIAADKLGITEMRAAKNAEEASAICQEFTPNAIISDINMPGMCGVDLCRQLKAKFADVQIIFLTGYVEKDYLKAAIDLHAIKYIEKPADVNDVNEAIKQAFDVVKKNDLALKAMSLPEEPVKEEVEELDSVAGNLAIDSVVDYIKKNYKNPDLSVKELADIVFLTPTYLSTLFKKTMRVTLGNYLTDIRMEEAKRLLKDPRYKLYEIAELVGYTDANYFAKTFKRKTGLSPSQYRDN